MKIIRIAWKAILEMVRDYRTLLISFAFPISFIIIFGWALGANYYTARIFVINNDKNVAGSENYGAGLIEMLGKLFFAPKSYLRTSPKHSLNPPALTIALWRAISRGV